MNLLEHNIKQREKTGMQQLVVLKDPLSHFALLFQVSFSLSKGLSPESWNQGSWQFLTHTFKLHQVNEVLPFVLYCQFEKYRGDL